MPSILTNTAAMRALREFRKFDKRTSETNDTISSGKKIKNGKDNAAYYKAGTTANVQSNALNAVHDSLQLSINALSVSETTSQKFMHIAKEIQDRVSFATAIDPDLDTDGRQEIQKEIRGLVLEMRGILDVSSFNGDSFIGTGTAQVITGFTGGGLGLTPTYMNINRVDLESIWNNFDALDVNVAGDLSPTLASVEADYKLSIQHTASLGIALAGVEEQKDLLRPLSDLIQSGASALVDADMEAVAAQKAANDVGMQLAIQSFSLTGPNSQNLMTLLGG